MPTGYTIKSLAPAKINYILEIGRKRKDGFHEIKTVFQTVSLFDVLHFKEIQGKVIINSNTDKMGPPEENLVYKAAMMLKRKLTVDKGVEIFIDKKIPVGAGLGGGSSDAACALKGLARLWNLRLDKKTLYEMASFLGADVPFFIEGGIATARGKGDVISNISRGIKPSFSVLLVYPEIHISTKEAYEKWDKEGDGSKGKGIDTFMKAFYKFDTDGMAKSLFNDFESVIIKQHPIIGEIKQKMKELGALGALMSGSGSSVFGIFPDSQTIKDAILKAKFPGKVFELKTI